MNRNLKKIICGLLIACLLTCGPIYAFSATTEHQYKAQLLQAGDFDLPQADIVEVSFYGVGDVVSIQQYLYEELLKCNPKITIDNSKYKFSGDEFKDIYSNVINNNPDLFYVTSSYSCSIYSVSKNVASVSPVYAMKQNEIDAAKTIFNDGVNKALKSVDISMDSIQKALVLHDYICDLATYNRIGDISHSAYGFFKDGNVVCAGYSLAYSYLLNQVGVECKYMSSSRMQHAWNAVNIDGKWYNVDLTYDDLGCYNQHENIRGAMRHNFFLKSDEFFKTDVGGLHFDYSTFEGSVCPDKSLDNSFWNDVNTNIPVVNGDYYYLDTEPTNYVVLKKRDVNGNEAYVDSSIKFSSPSFTLTGGYPDQNNVTHKVESKDVLIRMVHLDDRFYIAYDKKLKSVFPNGDNYDITALSNYPIGLGIENGNITYQPYETYTPITLDKNQYLNDYFTTSSSTSYNNYPDVHYDGVINTKDFAKNQNND